METFLLLLAFPIIWPFIAKLIWGHQITWTELALNIFGVIAIVSIVFFAGRYSETSDTEIWNGQIVSKHRVEDSYVESYSCNCYQSCSGTGKTRSCTTICQTCYRDHYTVDWFAMVDYGMGSEKLRFKHLDRLSRRVYNTPNPVVYRNCKIGEPASKTNGFTNYVKAAPESLFNTTDGNPDAYTDRVPSYPGVYGFYKVDRVLNVGSSVPTEQLRTLERLLDERLKTLGPNKQVNIIVIVTDILDPAFRHTVEDAWLGGKKNDSIVFIGTEGTRIAWADVMTFAHNMGNELYHVTLRDALMGLENFNAVQVAQTIGNVTANKFDRANMADFEYLKDEIDPPTWVIIMAAFFSVFGSVILSYVMTVVDIDIRNNSGYSSGRRFRIRRFR